MAWIWWIARLAIPKGRLGFIVIFKASVMQHATAWPPPTCKLAFFKMSFDVMIDLLAECENGHELLVTLDAIVSQD